MADFKRKTKQENPTKESIKKVRQCIKTGNHPRIYILFGPERYLVNQYRDELISSLTNAEDTMNVSRYNSETFDQNAVKNDAITMPFFAEHRVVIVDNSGVFDGSDPTLIEMVSEMPDTNVVIFCEEKVNKTKKAYKDATKNEAVICAEFWTPSKEDLITWIGSMLSEDGLKVKLSVPEKLMTACGSDMNMYMLYNEAHKIHDYCMSKGVVSDEDVDLLSENVVEDKIFKMCDALSQKNSREAIQLYNDLLELKRKPVSIILRITAQFDQLMQVREILDGGGNKGMVASHFHVGDFVAGKLINIAKSYSKPDLIHSVDMCHEALYLNNTGQLLDNAAVENLIIRLLEA